MAGTSQPETGGRARCLANFGLGGEEAHTQIVATAHAGAGAAPFARWKGAFGHGVHLQAVRLPGREARFREEPHRTISAMADEVAREILDGPAKPTVLYGHCFGGLVMYETTRRLEAESFPVVGLAVTAQPAPIVLGDSRTSKAQISDLPSEEFWAAVEARGGVPAELRSTPELLQMLEPALRSDWAAGDSYTDDGGKLTAPITGLLGTEDQFVSASEMEAWSDHTDAGFAFERCLGDHYLLQGPAADTVQQTLLRLCSGA